MAAVMRQAIQVDEEGASRDSQLLVQLQYENKTLRQILQITGNTRSLTGDDKETQTFDGDESNRSHNDSLSASTEVADILRQLDLPGEDSSLMDDDTESESETNCSMVSTIKRGTSMKDAASDSSQIDEEITKDSEK
jgi:hypothetical protein